MINTEDLYNTSVISNMGDLVKRSISIDYGIITEVVSSSVVKVELAAKTTEDATKITCNYMSLATKQFALYLKPEVGDKVVLLSPRLFNSEMFFSDKSVSSKDGYSMTSYLAFPLWFSVKDTEVKVKNDSDGFHITKSTGNVSIDIDKDGNINISTEKNVNIDCSKFTVAGNLEVIK